jgi:hypothetical protein
MSIGLAYFQQVYGSPRCRLFLYVNRRDSFLV